MLPLRFSLLGWLALAGLSCSPAPSPVAWQQVFRKLPSSLMSVWGTSARDVWAVGSDAGDGKGPMVLHYDGTTWKRLASGQAGDLWWVFGFKDGPVYMGGAGGLILKYSGQTFTKMQTPGNDGVFGIWGATPTDVWAVGGEIGGAQGAFAWRLQADHWVSVAGFPADVNASDVLWKVSGKSASDVWFVGTNGRLMHWDGTALTKSSAGTGESLFTVAANQDRFVAVGGYGTGTILENSGTGWKNVTPGSIPQVVGVALSASSGCAVGTLGVIYLREASVWKVDATALQTNGSLHGVWIDPDEGIWTVGGDLAAQPFSDGVLFYRGQRVFSGDGGL